MKFIEINSKGNNAKISQTDEFTGMGRGWLGRKEVFWISKIKTLARWKKLQENCA